MEHLPALGTAIRDIVKPTLAIYEPLLLQRADAIRSVPKHTYQYASHHRQRLDVYIPPNHPRAKTCRTPVLVFLYGGGLVTGDKTLPGYAGDLCHANVASFFASNYGYTVVVPDYRLVEKHDAKFPSGGEDVALVVEWLTENAVALGADHSDLFIMGNSAGGVHLSTFMLHPNFARTRARVLSGDRTRLRGVLLLSVPLHFSHSHESRAAINEMYFGDHESTSPLAMLRTAQEKGRLDFTQSDVRLLILNGDLDPEDEILLSRDDFLKQWMSVRDGNSRKALVADFMPGHNHISPFCSLGTGTEEEEAWGHQVAAFCENIRKFKPSVP